MLTPAGTVEGGTLASTDTETDGDVSFDDTAAAVAPLSDAPVTNNPQSTPPRREESVEEILEASIKYHRTESSLQEIMQGLRHSSSTIESGGLYPSIDQLNEEDQNDQKIGVAAVDSKAESVELANGGDLSQVVVTATAAAAAAPLSAAAAAASTSMPAAAVVVETLDDDPVLRKLRQDEQEALRMSFHSSTNSTMLPEVVAEATLETEVTGAAVVAEATLETIHSAAAAVMAQASFEDDMEMKPAALPSVAAHTEETTPAQVVNAYPDAMVQAYASIPHEEADVVAITDDFVHPSDMSSNDVQAEFIGQDYSGSYNLETTATTTTATTTTTTTAAAAAAPAPEAYATAEPFDTEEAEVLDTKPAATAPGWTNESHEATVLETRPQNQLWTEEEEVVLAEEIAVTGRDEAEATVVDISDDFHPSEGAGDVGVQAELIGNTPTVVDAEQAWGEATEMPAGEATVLSVAEEAHPQSSTGVQAVLIGNDYRATSVPITPPERPPPGHGQRSTSEPQHRVYPSKSSSDNNSQSRSSWTQPTPIVSVERTTPNDTPAPPNRDEPPIARAEVVESRPPPIPQRSTPRREQSRTSSSGSRGSQGSFNEVESRYTSQTRSSSSVGSAERRGLQMLTNVANTAARGTSNVMERLFGDAKPGKKRGGIDLDTAVGSIVPRKLLPWSVFPSENTGMWVATVNTNQKALDSNNIEEASKALRAFSVTTKDQAESLARAWAPPRMQPFADNNVCSICESRFAVFKRPCHCRNCGVCICGGCAVQWPSKMIPDTYNIKKESMVNICKSCDWLCSAFRLALLEGDHDKAVAIHSTGNVNLVTPFANVKGELFYPVHCAVLGKSLTLLKWLVDDHCCPLRSIRISGRTRDSSGSFTSILTSRGRSLLGIAMELENVDIIHYLVVDKGMPLSGEKELNMLRVIHILDKVLRMIPSTSVSRSGEFNETTTTIGVVSAINSVAVSSPRSQPPPTPPAATPATPPTPTSNQQTETTPSRRGSWRDDEDYNGAFEVHDSRPPPRDSDSDGSVADACIICFANTIDCVVTPCGHQICCMQCSPNISRCPVCAVDCSFIRVYKP